MLGEDEQGLVLTLQDREVLRCFITPTGMVAGGFVSQALGVKLPPLGSSVPVRISTGVLYRVLGVCQLDYSEEVSYILLDRLLEEAEMQRGATNLSD